MSAVDELARLIIRTFEGDQQTFPNYVDGSEVRCVVLDGSFSIEEVARVIDVEGYRKPRTITTAEELDALPFETVIRDAEGHVLERWGEPDESLWTTVMVNAFIPRCDIALPVTVLHEPEDGR